MKTKNNLMPGRFLTIAMLILFSFGGSILSQPGEQQFINLSLENGIPLNQTFAMIQDHTGYLWFGTMHGLIRFDGRNYKVYTYDPENPGSISFNDVVSIFEDSKNNLWIGTWGGGLNMLNEARTKFKRFVNDPSDKNSIGDNIIWSITEDKNGNIWIETGSSGINKYNPVNNEFTTYKLTDFNNPENHIHINYLFTDNDGIVWACGASGLAKFSETSNKFVSYTLTLDENQPVVSSVLSIYESSRKKIFVGTSNGLYRFDKDTKEYYLELPLSGRWILSITEDHNGIIWLGTTTGLIKYDQVNSTYSIYLHSDQSGSIYGNYVKTVFEDHSGVLWINCYNSGISKLINRKSNFSTLQENVDEKISLSNNVITSLVEDKNGVVWIGTEQGLNKYNPSTKSIEQISNPEISKHLIKALAVNVDNSIIFSSGSRLYNYNPIDKTLKNFLPEKQNEFKNKSINHLLIDKNGYLWIGTYNNGIFLLRDGKLNHHYLSGENSVEKSADFVLSFYEDSKGTIWIGTYGGLFSYNKNENTFTSYRQELNNPSTLSNNYVFCLTEDAKNNLWVGTASGLNLFDPGNALFKSFFEKDGLPNDVICGIANDNNGFLWISTQKGIARFDPLKNSFTNYNKDDGLQSNLFSPGVFLKGSDNEIYFGGRNGLNYFNPQNVVLNKYESPVVIASIELLDDDNEFHRIPENTGTLELDYDQNSLIIKVVSFDYSNPGRIMFRYKLNDQNNNWINQETGDAIKLQNLRPGTYNLAVQGTNGDGIWSSNKAELSFIILSPFWETPWFYIGVFIFFISTAYLILRLILRLKVKRALEIKKIKEEESTNLRKKTSIDFHDELGHRLTRISMLTELIKLKIGNTFTEVDSFLEQISENSRQLYEGTKDFIWSIDPSQDSLYELMIRLKDFGDELYDKTNVRFEITGLDEKLQNSSLNMDWKRHLTLIFKEGMNNSLKHSGSDKVLLNTRLEGDEIIVSLEDNGTGFIQDESKNGMGLKNMRARAEKLNATLSINTDPGKGTKILLKGKFPIKSLNYN